MFIIVEGPDNCGKTTLVRRLSGDLKLLVINNRKRPSTVTESRVYMDLVLPLTQYFPTIFDRWQSISEPIYGPLTRGVNLLDRSAVDFQFEVMEGFKPLIIYCRPPIDTICNFGPEEQMDGVKDHIDQIVKAYDFNILKIYKEWFPVHYYDWTEDPYESVLSRCKSHLTGKS